MGRGRVNTCGLNSCCLRHVCSEHAYVTQRVITIHPALHRHPFSRCIFTRCQRLHTYVLTSRIILSINITYTSRRCNNTMLRYWNIIPISLSFAFTFSHLQQTRVKWPYLWSILKVRWKWWPTLASKP